MSEDDAYQELLRRIDAVRTMPVPIGIEGERWWKMGCDTALHMIDPQGLSLATRPEPPAVVEPPPEAFALTALDPPATDVGTEVSVRVIGTGFTPKTAVLWDGTPRFVVTLVSTTELTMAVSLGMEEAARSVPIEVTDEAQRSNALPFTVTLPAGAP